MITDEEAQKSLDYLRDHAGEIAQAKANRVYMEEYRKSLKAKLMKEHAFTHKSAAAQEREAYADPKYIEHLEALKQAVEEEEKARWMMKAADAKIEAWRSFSANNRARF